MLVKEGRQVLTKNEVHHEKLAVGVTKMISDPWQMGVLEVGQEAGLALKGMDILRVGDERLLEGNVVAEARINGFVDGPHAALPDLAYDLVALVNEGTRLKHRGVRFVITTVATDESSTAIVADTLGGAWPTRNP